MNEPEERIGREIRIDPRSGGAVNPLKPDPIITVLPDKLQDLDSLLDEIRAALSSAGCPQCAAPFTDAERAAFALAVTRAYHAAVSRLDSRGPSWSDVHRELRNSAPGQTRLLDLLRLLDDE